MGNIGRYECGRCGVEVREGKRKHFCGEPYPLKATDDIRMVEHVPISRLRGAVGPLDEDAAARVAARWLNRDDHTDDDIAEMTAEMLRAAVGGQ